MDKTEIEFWEPIRLCEGNLCITSDYPLQRIFTNLLDYEGYIHDSQEKEQRIGI
jgi:hypothetical protein